MPRSVTCKGRSTGLGGHSEVAVACGESTTTSLCPSSPCAVRLPAYAEMTPPTATPLHDASVMFVILSLSPAHSRQAGQAGTHTPQNAKLTHLNSRRSKPLSFSCGISPATKPRRPALAVSPCGKAKPQRVGQPFAGSGRLLRRLLFAARVWGIGRAGRDDKSKSTGRAGQDSILPPAAAALTGRALSSSGASMASGTL